MLTKLLSLCLPLAMFVATSHATESKPNIIFILSDDLAQGDVGCHGQKLIQTPVLDRMAREGPRTGWVFVSVTVRVGGGLHTGTDSGTSATSIAAHSIERRNHRASASSSQNADTGAATGAATGASDERFTPFSNVTH